MTEYAFKTGARLRGDAQAIGTALEALEDSGAEEVVEAAANAESPLHPFFEWDDTVAGHKYRLDQARHLIRSVVIVRRDAANVPVPGPRAFIMVPPERAEDEEVEETRWRFVRIQRAQADVQMRRRCIQQMRDEIVASRRRLAEFEGTTALVRQLSIVTDMAELELAS